MRLVEHLAARAQQILDELASGNVTAAEASEPDTIRRLLVEQVTGRVRWRESILALKGLGVETTVECGGNKVLTGMVKRIDKDLASFLRTSRNQISEDRIIRVVKSALSESICYEDLVFATIERHHKGRVGRQMYERGFEAGREI